MTEENDKILLTGVCYVHRLLEERFSKPKRRYIKDVHPEFDTNNVLFFRDDISQRFLFTDFHGRVSSLKTEASDLPGLLTLYEDKCEAMYCVGSTSTRSGDVPNLKPSDFQKLSAFWYFLFNESWNPIISKRWADQRDQILLSLLNRFPKLKFIFYQEHCRAWWLKQNLPSDRMLFWKVDWGMTESDYEDIKRDLEKKGIRGGHRFPTEESYNDLCEMILRDLEARKRFNMN